MTSIRYDLGRKARDYGGWGTLEYWVVDLARRVVVVHTRPSDAGYGSVVILDTITPMPADGMEVRLTLRGLGGGQPTKTDEQALVAWAQAVFTRLAE